jgi:general secretion pathway protein M
MSVWKTIERYLARVPFGAAIGYAGLVLVLVIVTLTSIMDVFDRREAVAEAADTLSHLEGRSLGGLDTTGAAGSPLLEGPTVTVAGATLLQRVAGAITKVGGNIVSSQVDLTGPQAKDGFITVTANCEVDQPSLQQLLYNIESGMPFLFIDQLVVQAPTMGPGVVGGKMKVLISVSGQWQATK